jgi:hypothetical protein
VTDVKTCVVFDAPFGKEPGLEVALFEEEVEAGMILEHLKDDGWKGSIHPGKESPRCFWYLKTLCPLRATADSASFLAASPAALAAAWAATVAAAAPAVAVGPKVCPGKVPHPSMPSGSTNLRELLLQYS